MADEYCEVMCLPVSQCDHCRTMNSPLPRRVYVTRGGSVYHRTPHCEGLKDGQRYARWKGHDTHDVESVPRADVRARLGACEVCRPDLPPPATGRRS
ncbi:hypothetical protein [Streptomyces sp. CC208A]|uniref:hypothetical protein n=1 Tax=Streptomyces sp. CC208A TaxID=3044573 RepID=UPI0024A82454|nr:hypothetical protein [Streptomyces sp. CC208A]